MRHHGELLSCFLVYLLCAANGWAQDGVAPAFRPLSDSVTLHEPVLVEFTLRNGLGESIETDLGFNHKQNFAFTVITPDRRRVSVPPIAAEGFGETGRVSVQAGGTYRQVLLFNERYSFDTPGSYEVEAKFTGSIQTAGKKPVQAPSASTIRVTILPRNPERLSEVCESLAERAVRGSTYVEARDAALALSYVNDPIAVPSLARVLREGKLVRTEAAEGLARIATPQAVEVLTASLNAGDSELQAIARSALGAIERGGKGSEIKR